MQNKQKMPSNFEGFATVYTDLHDFLYQTKKRELYRLMQFVNNKKEGVSICHYFISSSKNLKQQWNCVLDGFIVVWSTKNIEPLKKSFIKDTNYRLRTPFTPPLTPFPPPIISSISDNYVL